jgi:hypothetical protein
MQKRLWNIVKLLFVVGLIYFLYIRLDNPARLWQQLVESNKTLLLAALLCYALAVATGAVKWGILLRSVGIPITPRQLFTYQWIAEFFNNFLPGQMGGDVMRGVALASDTQRRADAAASVLIDRFIGLMIFTTAATIGSIGVLLWGRPNRSPFIGDQRFYMQLVALGSAALTLMLLTLIAGLLSRRIKRWIDNILSALPLLARLSPMWQKIATSFNAHRAQASALLRSASGSALIVLLTSLTLWLIAQAIQPGSVSFLELFVINPMIVFVLIVPLSPGGIGVRQGALAVLFWLIGASYDLGVAVALVQQLITYLVGIPGGLLWLRRSK